MSADQTALCGLPVGDCPTCGHPLSHHTPEGGCGSCIWSSVTQAEVRPMHGEQHG